MLGMKHNLWSKAIMATSTILALGGASVVSAATGTWTITTENVGPGGSWSSFGSSNIKKNNSTVASFNGDVLPASFGYNTRLINSKAQGRSSYTGLYKDSTSYGENNTGTVNYQYYADVRSQSYEPNSSRVKLHFSSDRK